MAHAYTPGLKVAGSHLVRKIRRLPIKGEVLVTAGQGVQPETVVARAQLPGDPLTINLAYQLGIDPSDVPGAMLFKEGDAVSEGQLMAKTAAFFGLIKREAKSPADGTIEMISPITGKVTLRQPPVPIDVKAYIEATVSEIMPEEGAVLETRAAFIQGIFGVGGEREGNIQLVVDDPAEELTADKVPDDCSGVILVGGSLVSGEALRRAAQVGAAGVVAGGIIDEDLVSLLGHDLGVAITGHEDLTLTVIITEGFGRIRMADKTFALLKSLDGRRASINGATQIRAGVMRPEIICPGEAGDGEESVVSSSGLEPGTPIRCIREPFFGLLGAVTELPPELQTIETGAQVRILRARLNDGREVLIPRANVEIIEG